MSRSSLNLKSVFSYSIIKYIALLIGFLKGMINAAVLGPELLGVVGNLLLIFSYLTYCNLGILYSMNREYVLYKENNNLKAKDVLNITITFLLLISVMFFVIAITVFYYYLKKENLILAFSYLFLFLSAIFEQYRMYFINYFRLIDEVRKINIMELISNLVSLGVIVLFIFKFNIVAIMFSMFISGLLCFIYGYKNHCKIRLSINKSIFIDLIKVGIPLLIYNLGYYILSTVDRVMIIKYLGDRDLGYYTFANQIVQATLVFISSIIFLYYPKVIKMFNSEINDINKNRVFQQIKKFTKLIELISVALMMIGLIAINPFVNLFLPKYENSIIVYCILVIGVLIAKFSNLANIFIVSNKEQKYLLILQGISIVIAIVLNYIFIKLGYELKGIAFATMTVNIIYSISEFIVYLKISNIKDYIRNIAILYKKIIPYSIIILIIINLDVNMVVYILCIIVSTLLFYGGDYIKVFKERSKIL